MTSSQPRGESFSISELRLIQAWAEFHDLRLTVELDHSVAGETYEEVLSLYRKGSACRRCILWRTRTEVIVQPILGPVSCFPSIADALDSFSDTETDECLTDITPHSFAIGPEAITNCREHAPSKAA